MTLATLADVLQPALHRHYAVAGLVCQGWEDMRAFVAAAEAENAPLILQAGPACRANTPLPVLGRMMGHLAVSASVPVVLHFDHGYAIDECKAALDCGFTSLMYDGSGKALQQNIDETARVAEIAHAAGVSCEGEIGFVGYSGGKPSNSTEPAEAAMFATHSGVDAMAISVGNLHLQQDHNSGLDIEAIRSIEIATGIPLVIHGGSGVPLAQRSLLARTSNICKFNIGTELRMAFAKALRTAVNRDPNRFDHIAILNDTHDPLVAAARMVIRGLGPAA